MKRIVRIFLFMLSLGNLSQSAHAQQYPVQASVQLLPPYSVYLSDYANERLVVQLQLRDISKGEIPVRLRWQIRGGGVYLETNTTYRPTPNTVGVGMPLRLDGYDLAPYLRPENLLGNGGTAAWRRQAQLPEGMYTFCVQVLDDATGAVVSNAACASAWLLRHEPPFLNLPEHEAKPEARDPQQLTFQWTPRHTGRPNANFQTEYDFRLVEIWPDDRDPNDAMQSSIPLYETTTASTMLVYGMAEPLLIPGRRYAWQVRARSLVNGEALTMFNNQGNSEVRSFRWGDACGAITEVRAEALSGGRIRLRWEAPVTHSSYWVQYRQRGTSRWYQQETFHPEAIITRLQPSTAYEYQVGGYCGSIAAGLSTLASVGTLEEVVPEYACGLPVPAPNQESASPLPQLRVGEVIQAADFLVTVTESSGQAGQFSGKGTVALPWLREAVAQVTFQEVQINEAYQLTAGELVVTGVALEVVPEELTDALAEVYDVVDQASEAVDRAEEKLEAVDEALATAQEVYQKAQEVIGEDRSSSEPESGTPGAEVPPANGGSAPAADGSGGNVNVADGSDGSPDSSADSPRPTAASEAQDSVDVRVQFRPNANQAYGFDRKEHDALAADYPPTLINGETYSPAWKSVAAGRTDYVDAVAVAPDSSSVVVKFRTATGQSIAAQPGAKDSEQQLPVVGTTHETVDELTAYVVESDTAGNETETTVGQLNVISYDELRQKVIVVPVNDAVAPDAVRLSQDLNAIYGAAVAHWEVVIDDAFMAEAELLAGLDEGESGLLASFPRPMRQFNRAFKRSRDIDKDAYYVFLVADVSSSRAGQSRRGQSRRGFMPFKQQFGYIFTEQTTMLSQTIAHELGHGAFRLRHPFDEFGLAKGTTNNLMDYSEGTKLYKYQWDNVHDPEAMVGWLQGDEESALRSALPIVNAIREANSEGKKSLDLLVYGASATTTTLTIGGKNVRIVAITKPKGGKNTVNPGTPRVDNDDKVFGEEGGEFSAIKFFQSYDATLVIKTDREDGEAVKNYLLGQETAEFTVDLYEGSDKKEQDAVLLISTTPTMPDIRTRISSDKDNEFEVKLTIEYLRQCVSYGAGRTPNQSENFPATGWRKVRANEEWDINFGIDTETSRPKIRGGIANLIARSSAGKTDTLRFFIKGTNPTVAQVNTYLNQTPYNQIWFFKRIAFHESGTPNNMNDNARQYNVYNEDHENLHESWDSYSRCPNFGPPCGWGLMQLDNPAPPAQALWDWQANIQAGYDLLVGDKKGIVRTRMTNYMNNVTDWNDEFPENPVTGGENRNEGGITYIHGSSNYFQNEINNLDDHFDEAPDNNERSFLEASWMKAYNGLGEENRIFYYLESNSSNKPTWKISNTATYNGNINYYVNSIGEQQTPD